MSDPQRFDETQQTATADLRNLRWEDWLAAAAMLLLVVITFSNVLVRYLTNQSFAWSEELSVSLMVILTMAAAGAAVARDRHIRIEFFIDRARAIGRRRLMLLSSAATIVAFGILSALATRFAYDDYRYEVTSPGIGIPQWWYSIWLPLLAIVIMFRAIQVFVRTWRAQ